MHGLKSYNCNRRKELSVPARKDPATKKAVAKYKKEKTKFKGITFFPADMDILKYAEDTKNFSGYVKSLIRADMERNGCRNDESGREETR